MVLMTDADLSTSRLGRATRLGHLAAWSAALSAGTKSLNVARSQEAARAAEQRAMLATADRMVTVLGTMRGGAMKIGQTLSMFDFGIVDDDVREEFQAKMAALQSRAPSVPFAKMRKVIERDLGMPLGEAFAAFEEDAIAAASIGQVYRARLHDGRAVAVKVQYPGIGRVVQSDMQNLGLILKAFSRIAPGVDSEQLASELRERIVDELDYELEAANQRALARVYRGHPGMVVPDVVSELCATHVLVSEYVEGRRFDEVLDDPQELRDRLGETMFRFYLCDPHRHGLLNGDPHPGNCLVLDDGRIGFLDFGFFKRLSVGNAGGQAAFVRAVLSDDVEGLYALSLKGGAVAAGPDVAEELMHAAQRALGWLARDEDVTMSRQIVNELMTTYTSAGDRFDDFRVPADHGIMFRVLGLVAGGLGQLRATANWHAIAREVLEGGPPTTELGRAAAAHWQAAEVA